MEDDGIEVVSIHGMGISVNFNLALVEPPEILAFALENLGTNPPADALFISCTNYQAVATLPRLKETYDLPIVTSNQAALEAVGAGVGAGARGDGMNVRLRLRYATPVLTTVVGLRMNRKGF